MRFELKQRHVCYHVFFSSEELFGWLGRRKWTISGLQGKEKLEKDKRPNEMVYVGTLCVGNQEFPSQDEYALYIHEHTSDELRSVLHRLIPMQTAAL